MRILLVDIVSPWLKVAFRWIGLRDIEQYILRYACRWGLKTYQWVFMLLHTDDLTDETLYAPIEYQKVDIVTWLLDTFDDAEVECHDLLSRSCSSLEMVRLIISHFPEMVGYDKNAVEICCREGYVDVLEYIIDNIPSLRVVPDDCRKEAIVRGHVEIVALLIETTNLHLEESLIIAKEAGQEVIVQLIQKEMP